MQVRLSLFSSWSFSFLLIAISAAAQAGTPSNSSTVTNESCGHLACAWNAFGPQMYQRRAGDPEIVRSRFSVLNPRAVYTLRLQGTEDAYPAVRLNGRSVLDTDDFRRHKEECGRAASHATTSCASDSPSSSQLIIEKGVALASSNTLEVEARGHPGGSFTLSIFGVDPGFPSIAATLSPSANSSGWNNSRVTVAFTCSDPTSGIASCPGPVTLNSEGLNQPVSGTALNRAGSAATLSLQVSVDSTPPTVALLHPANGQTVASSTVNVNGVLADGLSGADPASVTCNGMPAMATAASFACNVSLAGGANQIQVQARDRAGNLASSSLNVVSKVAPLPPPLAIFFTPSSVTLLARQTHGVALLGDRGQVMRGAALASSDPQVVAVSGDGTLVLQAMAPGSATITASLGRLSATLQVKVLPGTEFPSGTRLFALDPLPGNSLTQIFSSDAFSNDAFSSGASSNNPEANGPAFLAVDSTPAGETLRAINRDGAQMWSAPLGIAPASSAAAQAPGRIEDKGRNQVLQRWLDIEAQQASHGGAAPVTRAILRVLRPLSRQRLPRPTPRLISGAPGQSLNTGQGGASGLEANIEAGVADESGGVISLLDAGSQSSLVRLDGQTGQTGWEYDSPGSIDPQIAISPEGRVYFLETLPVPPPPAFGGGGDIVVHPGPAVASSQTPPLAPVLSMDLPASSSSHLNVVGLDVLTGAPVLRFNVPDSIVSGQGVSCQGVPLFTQVGPSDHGPLTLTAEGLIALEYMQTIASDTTDSSNCDTTSTAALSLNLLTLEAQGQATTRLLFSSGGTSTHTFGQFSDPSIFEIDKNAIFPTPIPSGITPDGQGGLLAQWTSQQLGGDSQCVFRLFKPPDCTLVPAAIHANITAVGGEGGINTFTVPLSSWDSGEGFLGGSQNIERVLLSDNGTAIAHNGAQIVGFDVNTHGITFQFERPLNTPNAFPGSLAPALLQVATTGGGAAAILPTEVENQVMVLDASGAVRFPAVGAYSGIQYAGGNQFLGFFPPDAPGSVFSIVVPEIVPADSEWFEFQSSQGKRRDGNPVVITKIDTPRGMVGNTYAVKVTGLNFGAHPQVILADAAGKPLPDSQIKVSQVSYDKGTQTILSTFQIAPDAPGGKVFPRVAARGMDSKLGETRTFFVQIPTTLIRDTSYGPNKDGLGGIISVTDGDAFNIAGASVTDSKICGIYENVVYLLQDQEQHGINAAYTITEDFTDYISSNPQLTQPQHQEEKIKLSNPQIDDIQLFSTRAPVCPGPNDHESFTQHIAVKVGKKADPTIYPLPIVNRIVRGYFSGKARLDITISLTQ